MKNIRKIAAVLMTLLLCVPFFNVTSAKAAGTARVSIGSASGTVGETVSVTVSIDASFEIGAATIYVSYDTSVLEPVSGSNTGTVTCNFLDSNASSSQSSSISFRIKAAGTSSLSVIGDSKVISMDYDNASISRSSGSITGIAPASYSTDNTLSSLEISPGVLSPAFSSNVTTYTTSVGSDCDRLTVSAAPNDSKATVKVSGTRMDPGLNTTTITVTAENGSKKVYTIKTTKSDNVITPEQASKEAEETDGGSHFPKKKKPKGETAASSVSKENLAVARGWLPTSDKYDLLVNGAVITAFPALFLDDLAMLRSSLRIVQAGTEVAEVKGKDLIPAHGLAMSRLLETSLFPTEELTYEQAIAYLRKEAITLSPSVPRGYVLVTYKKTPLGFVKNIGNRANNLYPQEWRIRSGYLPEDIRTL